MLQKTKGVVLKLTDYGDSSVVAHIFTEQLGMQAYMIHGAKKPKARVKTNMLQFLQLLDMVVQYKPNGNLQRINELKLSPAFLSIPYDMAKTSVVLFINEMLYKVLKNHGPDERLFQFVHHTIIWLDAVERMPTDFHLYFLIRLTKYLGFQPGDRKEGDLFFDLKDGVYLRFDPLHPLILGEPFVSYMDRLAKISLEELASIRITREERRYLLEKIVEFYRLHVSIGEIKSHAILEEVLS